MMRWLAPERVAPIVAGIAGMAWFWLELAPQRAGFEDTDNPAIGLAFIDAHRTAWPLAGLALGITAIALVATVLSLRMRLGAASDGASSRGERGERGVAVDTVSVIGFFAAAMLFGMAAIRMSGGPVRYVQGLDQAWGEAAYLVTQFVGIQALATGGLVLLDLWLVGIAWIGARRGVVPRFVALLAVVPALRLVGALGPFGIDAEGMWLLVMIAIPAAFAWLVVLGAAIPPSKRMSTDDRLASSSAAREEGGQHLGEAST